MLRHSIANSHEREDRLVTVASNAIFSRDMERVYNIADDTRTLVVEGVLHLQWDTFSSAKRLRSVVIGDGPKVLG